MHNLGEYTWYVHLKKDSVPVEVGDLIGYGNHAPAPEHDDPVNKIKHLPHVV